MTLLSRKDAKSIGVKRFFTGKPCIRGHIAERFVSTNSCIECMRGHFQTWRAKNTDRDRRKSRDWQKANPAKVRESIARREAAISLRIPSWADRSQIKQIYAEAVRLSRESGIKYHVDHEIPLFGRRVSGLHIAENLRVITAVENKKKSNSFSI